MSEEKQANLLTEEEAGKVSGGAVAITGYNTYCPRCLQYERVGHTAEAYYEVQGKVLYCSICGSELKVGPNYDVYPSTGKG